MKTSVKHNARPSLLGKPGAADVTVPRLEHSDASGPHSLAAIPVQPKLKPAGSGRALPGRVRARMERVLGHDLSNGRVHEGDNAGAIDAVAYTQGNAVHFQRGAYNPESPKGLELLGHELAHVAQQREGRVAIPSGRGGLPINDQPHLEQEADRLGRAAAQAREMAPAPTAPSVASGAQASGAVQRSTAPIQPVWVRVVNGKVEQDWKSPSSQSPGNDWVWMSDKEFVEFKNAGKRHAGNKWTDKTSGTKYYSKDGVNFFTDKTMKTKVQAPKQSDLVDRRRPNRTSSNIELFDVASYSESKKNEKVGDQMEHDHVMAGESMKQRYLKEKNNSFEIPDKHRSLAFKGDGKKFGGQWAYDNAPSIEIRGKHHPEGWDHNMFSSTWGSGRQKAIDKAVLSSGSTVSMDRPQMDGEIPGAAFYRDTDTMLKNTKRPQDQVKQVGAYRYLYKKNLKVGNINPSSNAFDMTGGDPLKNKNDGGGVTYTEDPKSTQGSRIDSMLNSHIKVRVSKPGGEPSQSQVLTNSQQQQPLLNFQQQPQQPLLNFQQQPQQPLLNFQQQPQQPLLNFQQQPQQSLLNFQQQPQQSLFQHQQQPSFNSFQQNYQHQQQPSFNSYQQNYQHQQQPSFNSYQQSYQHQQQPSFNSYQQIYQHQQQPSFNSYQQNYQQQPSFNSFQQSYQHQQQPSFNFQQNYLHQQQPSFNFQQNYQHQKQPSFNSYQQNYHHQHQQSFNSFQQIYQHQQQPSFNSFQQNYQHQQQPSFNSFQQNYQHQHQQQQPSFNFQQNYQHQQQPSLFQNHSQQSQHLQWPQQDDDDFGFLSGSSDQLFSQDDDLFAQLLSSSNVTSQVSNNNNNNDPQQWGNTHTFGNQFQGHGFGDDWFSDDQLGDDDINGWLNDDL